MRLVYLVVMHELGIAENILGIVESVARENGLRTVQTVSLEIGPLSGVDAESLRFALDALSPGTLLEGTRIDIAQPPLELACRGCGSVYQPQPEDMRCPHCGEASFDTRRGREMLITQVVGA